MSVMAEIDGMRRSAALLSQRASRLGAIGARLDSQVAAMSYAGPAANRFRADIASRRQQISQAAGQLQALADALMQAAAVAEASLPALGMGPTPGIGR